MYATQTAEVKYSALILSKDYAKQRSKIFAGNIVFHSMLDNSTNCNANSVSIKFMDGCLYFVTLNKKSCIQKATHCSILTSIVSSNCPYANKFFHYIIKSVHI